MVRGLHKSEVAPRGSGDQVQTSQSRWWLYYNLMSLSPLSMLVIFLLLSDRNNYREDVFLLMGCGGVVSPSRRESHGRVHGCRILPLGLLVTWWIPGSRGRSQVRSFQAAALQECNLTIHFLQPKGSMSSVTR